MNLLLILVAMLSGLSGAMGGTRGSPVAEVQQTQAPASVALLRAAVRAAPAAHRSLPHPLPVLADVSIAPLPTMYAPVLAVRSIVEIALE